MRVTVADGFSQDGVALADPDDLPESNDFDQSISLVVPVELQIVAEIDRDRSGSNPDQSTLAMGLRVASKSLDVVDRVTNVKAPAVAWVEESRFGVSCSRALFGP